MLFDRDLIPLLVHAKPCTCISTESSGHIAALVVFVVVLLVGVIAACGSYLALAVNIASCLYHLSRSFLV